MINLKNLVKSYGDKEIIKGLSLSVSEGERVTIIGPSGCGKSTLLRLLMGLHFADSGEISVDGQVLSRLSEKELQRIRLKFGMLFQSGALFDSMTVFDNVAFPLRECFSFSESDISDIVSEKLTMVGMPNSGHLMPSDLSGGMRKRIGLARAIAGNPSIILYDEPTTGLDPILSTTIEDLIVKMNVEMNCTSIIVTHQISTILRTADKIYMMYKGQLLPAELPDSIFESSNEVVRDFITGGLGIRD